ncbi:acyl-CoA dehydrogenase family protein [Kitasatospora saccharophila]|uniref:acyl-CoA dehydrogenase family protein n=1 Tax=Kitasatospora saccharophila TaxID=407973 RepID=UPI00362F4539
MAARRPRPLLPRRRSARLAGRRGPHRRGPAAHRTLPAPRRQPRTGDRPRRRPARPARRRRTRRPAGGRPGRHRRRPAAPGRRPAPDPVAAAWRQLALAAILLGTARAALDWSAARLRDTAAAHRRPLGELDAALTGAEELVHGLAARTDADPAAATRAPAVQLLAARTAGDTVQRALTLTGSAGLDRRHPLERHLRDTLSLRAQLPAEDAVLDALGEALLGG